MNKIILSILICGFFPLDSMAADEDTERRLQRLEATVNKLQSRITRLETRLSQKNLSIGSNNNAYVCSLSPFTKTYKGESNNQGVAKRQAQQACLKDHDIIFCGVERISCERY